MDRDNGWDFFSNEDEDDFSWGPGVGERLRETLAPVQQDDYLALAADLLAHDGTTLYADRNMGDPRIVINAETTNGTHRNVSSTTLSFVKTDYINGI